MHFIFVNRTTNHVIASSFSERVYEADAEHDMHVRIQRRVWRQFARLRRRLSDGFTTALVRDDDLLFTYFLWFEDSQVYSSLRI